MILCYLMYVQKLKNNFDRGGYKFISAKLNSYGSASQWNSRYAYQNNIKCNVFYSFDVNICCIDILLKE